MTPVQSINDQSDPLFPENGRSSDMLLDSNTEIGLPYVLRESPGRGNGLFAIRSIKCGTKVTEEPPLISLEHMQYSEFAVEEAFKQLSESSQESYLNLASCHGSDPRAWADGTSPEPCSAAASPERSIYSIWQTNCDDEANPRETSENRRSRIVELRHALGQYDNMLQAESQAHRPRAIEAATEICQLLEKEGLRGLHLVSAYRRLARLYVESKRYHAALVSAQKTLEIEVICLGSEHESAESSRQLVKEVESRIQADKGHCPENLMDTARGQSMEKSAERDDGSGERIENQRS
ncbi:MAG: hypothetical protein M1822_000122 [Bathelium mastoideum]|nr:MAG: hypothetical protein M1822_000122 [Bathelium mastoideum]